MKSYYFTVFNGNDLVAEDSSLGTDPYAAFEEFYLNNSLSTYSSEIVVFCSLPRIGLEFKMEFS